MVSTVSCGLAMRSPFLHAKITTPRPKNGGLDDSHNCQVLSNVGRVCAC